MGLHEIATGGSSPSTMGEGGYLSFGLAVGMFLELASIENEAYQAL